MLEDLNNIFRNIYQQNFAVYVQSPFRLITLILDISIVCFLFVKIIQVTKKSRAWQLVKGIFILLMITILSGVLKLNILNYILTSIMTYGAIALVVIFQPEIRRGLEQLGTNKITKFFGFEKDVATKTKEDIYKIAIAATELAKTKTGALIVIERDIKIKDIISTGIEMNAEVSPQLLVNIFVPNTPLHDGAVIISNNKIAAAACMLPLSDDSTIEKKFGTRHRSALGISKESDAIVVVVSEETGKISIALDGNLIVDVKEDALKQILIKYVITKRFVKEKSAKIQQIKNMKNKFAKHTTKKINKEIKKEDNEE